MLLYNGTIIESSTQNVVPGPQRVTLNFSMPVGTDYELGLDNPNQIGIFRSIKIIINNDLVDEQKRQAVTTKLFSN